MAVLGDAILTIVTTIVINGVLSCFCFQLRLHLRSQLLVRQVVTRNVNSYKGKLGCAQLTISPYCRYAKCKAAVTNRRSLKGSSATVDRGSEVLFYFEMACHPAVVVS